MQRLRLERERIAKERYEADLVHATAWGHGLLSRASYGELRAKKIYERCYIFGQAVRNGCLVWQRIASD
eukprot:SAG11_NODE_4927_length_1720_cov_1.256015_3_plen_69_part_00